MTDMSNGSAPDTATPEAPAAAAVADQYAVADRRLRKIWARYKRTGSRKLRNALLEHYLPLVRRAAERVAARLPASVQLDDLVSVGVLGLMDAVDAFDPNRRVRFATFSATRIRGAILDELRAMDWVPRLARSNARKFADAATRLESELGRAPSDEEVAQRLGLPAGEFEAVARDARSTCGLVSLSRRRTDADGEGEHEEITRLADPRAGDPEREAQRRMLKQLLTRGLSRAEQLIVTLYYYEDLTMSEIGRALALSESRVSQLHSGLLRRLRTVHAGRKAVLNELAVA